ncbi:MAG: hypothetical protein HOI95_22385 [Chromatiales bacterium]|nr:hypothetical protein [Chromatiales bacterium]
MTELERWLRRHGLDKHLELLVQNDVDMDVLDEISESDLSAFGLSFRDRKRFLRAVLEAAGSASALGPDAPIQTGAGSAATPEGAPELRQPTVMFCDLVGSVELGERMHVEDYRDFLEQFRRAVESVFQRDDEFIAHHKGDGLLVYFGFPKATETDAERAVRAGLNIVNAIQKLDHGYDVTAQVRVGIATGSAIVGDRLATGDAAVTEQAALGPAPNFAARLPGAAIPDSVVISETTAEMVGASSRCWLWHR